ncbi:MAG: radical SAM protein [Desulfobacterales bacterium]|nr:radical SAM protein [Desulfobacterales bacterium]
MRILIINSNRYRNPYPVIPFGLSRVASAVENAGHQVRVLDLCFSKDCASDILNAVNKNHPDIIGITIRNIDTGTGYNANFLLKEIKDEVIVPCKKVFSGPIVIGGPAVGISGSEMLSFLDLEFAIRGDGEAAIVEFLNRLEKKLPLDGLGGLVRRENNQIIEDNLPMRVTDLDSLPLANPHRYIDLQPYINLGAPLQIQTKRGCALKCTYCTYNKVEGPHYRLRSPKLVADEIEYFVKETGIRRIEFTDSTFNIPLDHSKSVLRALAAKKLDLILSTMGMNPGAIDEELVDLMKEVNFHKVDLGVEAGCDAMLTSFGKNFNKEDILRSAEILHKKGIPICWSLLLGAPGETEQTLMETFKTMKSVASFWELVVIAVGIRAYKGTPIAEDMQRENPNCTEDNFLHPVGYSPNTLSLDEIKAITIQLTALYPNYYMYDEDIHIPPIFWKCVSVFQKLFSLDDQPKFKFFIFFRMLQKLFDINFLKYIQRNKLG